MSACKLASVPPPDLGFTVNSSDMPVICALKNADTGIQIIDVDILDLNDLAKGPLPLHFSLPGSSFLLQLPKGNYSVHVFLSPANGASAGLPFGGRTVFLVEQCDAQTILCTFQDATPQPFFSLEVD